MTEEGALYQTSIYMMNLNFVELYDPDVGDRASLYNITVHVVS